MIDIKQTLIEIIHKHAPGCKIFLFGSRARGTHREGADYDIAIDAGEKLSNEVMLNIAGDIDESDIYVNVDVVDLHGVSEKFLAVIREDLVPWTKE
ncbi:MAG: uncharacterized protein QG604_291 [Candidatus Dependentiae bacterium]|nr:uncharacterized protein [Candidatus Dependentiae bacterium]